MKNTVKNKQGVQIFNIYDLYCGNLTKKVKEMLEEITNHKVKVYLLNKGKIKNINLSENVKAPLKFVIEIKPEEIEQFKAGNEDLFNAKQQLIKLTEALLQSLKAA